MQPLPRSLARVLFTLVVCGTTAILPATALTTNTSGQPPVFKAAAAILIDSQTGQVLYALHPDLPYPPASLTKMMTLAVALRQIDEGRLGLNQEIVPVRQAWAISMPPDSSLMFLGPNQRLTVKTLLTGLIVDSGNDAAYEIAYLVAGSVPAFAKLMNQEANRMGFPQMHFVEPSGLSSHNRITAREYAEFCRAFIRLHPDTLKSIFAVKEFSYPQSRNLTNGSHGHPILQYNRNLLLWDYPGTDGFKTGFINESGYNMAVTAERHGMRLISVVLGVYPNRGYNGEQLRARDEKELLNYGFDNFEKVAPQFHQPDPVHVWKGAATSLQITPDRSPVVVIPKGHRHDLKVTLEQTHNVLAPVNAGAKLGNLIFSVAGKQVREIPLVAPQNVPLGGMPRRAIDSVVLFVRSILGLAPARPASELLPSY